MKYRYFVLFLIALLPQFLFRDFTPDNELRYLSIANENLALNRYFAFLHHGLIYADKPPLYLWLVMLLKKILGYHSMFFLGLFSVLPSFVIIKLMDRWVVDLFPSRQRLMAAMILFSSVFFLGSAVVLRMDMLMTMFMVMALYTYYAMYAGSLNLIKGQLFLGIFVFLAVFSKGPLGLIVPILTIFVFLLAKRKLTTFGRYWSWRTCTVLGALSLCWFFFVWLEGGSEYLSNLLLHQTVDRAVNAFHHKRPFYFYGISIWYVVAPWSILLLSIYVNSIKSRLKLSDLELLFLVTSGVTFIFLSLLSSKVDIYLLPTLPFLIYLAILLQNRLQENTFTKIGIAIPAVVFTLASPALLIFLSYSTLFTIPVLLVVCSFFLSVTGIVGLYYMFSGSTFITATFILGWGFLITIFIAGFTFTTFNDQIGYGSLAKAGIGMMDNNNKPCYISLNLRRAENMDVYLGTDLHVVSKDSLISGIYTGCVLFIDRKMMSDTTIRNFLGSNEYIYVGERAAYLLSK